MAAITLGIALASTTNATSYASGSFTPAANDLLVLVVERSTAGTAASATSITSTGYTGGWSLAASALHAASANIIETWVANALCSAVATNVTVNCASSSGAITNVYRISGMSFAGPAAVRQIKNNVNLAAGTPTPVLPAAALTTNPVITAVGNNLSPAGLTPPTGWTLSPSPSTGYSTPTTGLAVAKIDSGFTSATITWTSSSSTAYGAVSVEFDATVVKSATDNPTISVTESVTTEAQPTTTDTLTLGTGSQTVLIAADSNANQTFSNSVIVPAPSGYAAGDVFVAHIVWTQPSTLALTPPAGWTLVSGASGTTGTGGSDLSFATYYRIATASEGSATFTLPGGSAVWVVSVAAVRGIDTANPVVAANSNPTTPASTANISAVSATPAGAADYLVGFFSISASGGSGSDITIPAGLSTGFVATAEPASAQLAVRPAFLGLSSSSATGTETATYVSATTAPRNGSLIILRQLVETGTVVPSGATSISASDTLTISETESSSAVVNVTASDTLTISETESVTTTAGLARTDDPTISVTDTSAVAVPVAATDTPTVSVSDVSSLTVAIAATDTLTISGSELLPPSPLTQRSSLWAATNKSATSSWTFTNNGGSIAAGRVIAVALATDNTDTAAAGVTTSLHTALVDSGGNTYTKAREYTYGGSGAGNGVTVSLWSVANCAALSGTGTVTATFASSVTAMASVAYDFTATDPTSRLSVTTGVDSVDAAARLGSLGISGLDGQEHLVFRAVGYEADVVTIDTTSGWTALPTGVGTTGGASDTNIGVTGEFIITSATSAISGGTSAYDVYDHASVLVAFTTAVSSATIVPSGGGATPISASDTLTIGETESKTLAGSSTRTDNPTASVSDVSSLTVAIAATDTPTIAVTDTSAVAVQISTTDNPTVSISDASTSALSTSTTDAPTISVSDVSASALASSSTDSPTVSISDASTSALSVSTTDNPTVSVAETDTTTAGASATDTPTISVSDVSTSALATTTTDSPTVSVSDTSSVQILNSLSATDAPTVSVTDTSTSALSLSRTDNPTISETETQTSVSQLTATDALAVSVGDTVATSEDAFASSDTVTISVTETSQSQLASSRSDAPTVSISDASTSAVSTTTTDTQAIGVTESVTTAVNVSTTDTLTVQIAEDYELFNGSDQIADEDIVIGITESQTSALSSGRTDTTTVSVTDAAQLTASLSATDSVAAALTEQSSVVVSVSGTDAPGVSVTDTTTSAIAATTSDTPTVSVTETSTSAVTSTRTDNPTISVTDSSSVTTSDAEVDKSASDTLSIGATETRNVTVQISATDTAAVSVADSSTASVQISSADTLGVSATGSVLTNLVTLARQDALTILVTEATDGFADTTATDTLTVLVTDQGDLGKPVSASDTLTIRLTDTGTRARYRPRYTRFTQTIVDDGSSGVRSTGGDRVLVGTGNGIKVTPSGNGAITQTTDLRTYSPRIDQ